MAASKPKDRQRKRGTLSLRIDHELHRAVKITAASEGLSMADLVDEALRPRVSAALRGHADHDSDDAESN